MNFGIRLPGPFRVGISDKGRVSAGMTLGPFSVSSGGGGQPTAVGMFYRGMTLEQAIEKARAEGFKVGVGTRSAYIHKGYRAGTLSSVHGGVMLQRATSNLTVYTVLGLAALGIFLFCALPQLLS